MRRALAKAVIESELADRFQSAFKPRAKTSAGVISAGITEVDALTGGLPRGAITEIFGPASSGRTSLMLAALAHASTHDEVCALVDTSNTFDPKSATNAQLDLDRLLWVRCDGKLEHAFKALDLLLQGGGFGLIVLDLGDVPAPEARRIISSWWYRFRRVVEHKPTVLLVIAADSCVRSCAAMTLEIHRESAAWVSINEPESSLNSQTEAVASRSEISLFNEQSLVVREQKTSGNFEAPNNERSLSNSPGKLNPSLPTHTIILRRTGWLLERLKPVHFGERAVQYESYASC